MNVNKYSIIGMMSRKQINARHTEKIITILIWLARYNFTSVVLLGILLKINVSNVRALLKKMVGDNLVKTELLPSGHRIYGIATAGIGMLDNIQPMLADIARPFQAGRTPVSTFAHQYNIQLAELSLSMFGWSDFAAGRELCSYRAAQIPDLVGLDQNGLVAAIEVELHLKSSQRMKIVCSNYAELVDLERDPCIPYQRILYLTPHPKRLSAMLDKYVPAKKRYLFEADQLYPAPLLLTPRRYRGEDK